MERLSLDQTLSILLNKITIIRNKNKNKEDFDELYILFKCFFKLLDINFPHGPFKLPSIIDNNIKVLYDKIIDEFVILGYYLDYKELALRLSDNLIFDLNCKIEKNQIISNQRYYIQQLKINKKDKFNIKLESNQFALNPSIIKQENGYLINCRVVNYQLTDQGLYIIHHPNRTIITKNILLYTDTNLNIINQKEIIDKSNYQKYEGRNIIGLEDLIMFKMNEELWFTCTTLDTNINGLPQISMCKIENNHVIVKHPIHFPNNRPEKNWLPFIHDGILKLIYEYHPFTIKTIIEDININQDPINTHVNIVNTKDILKNTYGLNLSRFKGSAAPIDFSLEEEGYLIIVHETFNLSQGPRCYLHRFIWINKDLIIKKMSHPWYFQHHGIEFCRSMCHSYISEEIILTYSIHDKDAQWCSINTDYIKELLHDLDYFSL